MPRMIYSWCSNRTGITIIRHPSPPYLQPKFLECGSSPQNLAKIQVPPLGEGRTYLMPLLLCGSRHPVVCKPRFGLNQSHHEAPNWGQTNSPSGTKVPKATDSRGTRKWILVRPRSRIYYPLSPYNVGLATYL